MNVMWQLTLTGNVMNSFMVYLVSREEFDHLAGLGAICRLGALVTICRLTSQGAICHLAGRGEVCRPVAPGEVDHPADSGFYLGGILPLVYLAGLVGNPLQAYWVSNLLLVDF